MAPVLGDQVFDRSHTRPQAIRRYCAIRCAAHDGQDRKSTRLNSSHSQISYAVFCLKKKKKTICTELLCCLSTEVDYCSLCVSSGKHTSFQTSDGFRDSTPNVYSRSNCWVVFFPRPH